MNHFVEVAPDEDYDQDEAYEWNEDEEDGGKENEATSVTKFCRYCAANNVTKYEPNQFPGIAYRMDDLKVVGIWR